MKLLDVNVLVYAHREDAPDHSDYRSWLEQLANGGEAFSVPDLVFSGFLRIVTHPRVFDPPTDLRVALRFVQTLRECANHVVIGPGPGHWSIFTRLVRESSCRGNLIPDAFLAAIVIESGNILITTDHGYGRFRDLDWRHPLHAP